jgi:DNA-binding NtrC family response regulator
MSETRLQIGDVLADQLPETSNRTEAAETVQRRDGNIPPLRILRAQAEIKGIQSALELTGWNRKRAARLLKISYRGLLYKIRQHNIIRNVAESS